MTRALLLAVLLLTAVRAGAEKILIIGDSHTVGPFGAALDQTLAAKGNAVSMNAVCSATSSWWMGVKRRPLSICWSIHPYGGKNAPGDGAPNVPVPTVKELADQGPEAVVVALGSNPDGGAADTASASEKLLALLPKNARCFWVGPPPMPKRLEFIDKLYAALPEALARAAQTGPACALIDSRKLISPKDASPNDHFYGPKATAWGKAVAGMVAP